VNVIKTPIYDARGQIIGIQGIFWDITERKRFEERLQKANRLEPDLPNRVERAIDYVQEHKVIEHVFGGYKGFRPKLGGLVTGSGFGAGPEWSFAQLGATAVATAGVLVFLGALHRAVGGFDGVWWLLALVPVVSMPWAGSIAPLALWGVLLVGWFVLTPAGAYSWWSLVAAAGVVVGHAAPACVFTNVDVFGGEA